MRFAPFSKKQLRVLTWWRPGSPDRQKDAILCDGAVRSGKTLCLSLSFVMWATHCFSGRDFALCGKTILSLQRNLLSPSSPFCGGWGTGVGSWPGGECLWWGWVGTKTGFTSSADGMRAAPPSSRALPWPGSCWMRSP